MNLFRKYKIKIKIKEKRWNLLQYCIKFFKNQNGF